MPSLSIGDEQNAILILQQSQADPQKAVAELVENSIDAKARHVRITRLRKHGRLSLLIADDGEGIRANPQGDPDMDWVATHICDSLKRHLTPAQKGEVQGQFGIGMLGFAAVGEELIVRSRRTGSRTKSMRWLAYQRDYEKDISDTQLRSAGTEVEILGIRREIQNRLTAEKLQRYLSEELRDRIRRSAVHLVIDDKVGVRKQLAVKPREFAGEPLNSGQKEIPTPAGLVKLDLYFAFPKEGERALVSVARNGTRLLPDVTECEELRHSPWDCNLLEGQIDFSGLTPAPATRRGFLPDEGLERLVSVLSSVEPGIQLEIEQLRKRLDERISAEVLEKLKRAFAEAMDELAEDYSWFERAGSGIRGPGPRPPGPTTKRKPIALSAGPLHELRVSPKVAVIGPEETRILSARCFDPSGALIPSGVSFLWWTRSTLIDLKPSAQVATVRSFQKEGEALVRVTARLKGVEKVAESRIVVTNARNQFGFPPPDPVRGPMESWRSKYSPDRGVLEINIDHRDYVRAKTQGGKSYIRYLSKLYAKELVLLNMGGASAGQVLESMVELTSILEAKL